jgi:hypothetical protein
MKRAKQTKDFDQAAAAPLLPPIRKVPRPPNSFMLFGLEWRKKLAADFPSESNRSISVR